MSSYNHSTCRSVEPADLSDIVGLNDLRKSKAAGLEFGLLKVKQINIELSHTIVVKFIPILADKGKRIWEKRANPPNLVLFG